MNDLEVECIVKLGGRAVTVKETHETVNTDAIKSAAGLFYDQQSHTGKFIVVHGAGSFGHFEAKKYGVADGYKTNDQVSPKEVQMGLCHTRLSVTKLNHLILSEFVKQGIPAVGMSPFNNWVTDNKDSVVHADIDVLTKALHQGYLPVLHGDAVIDQARGCSILGGDHLIEELATRFNPKRVVFLTDVNGIYDIPPDQPGANHISQITVNQNGHIATNLTTTASGHDVTGGIMGKIDSACRIAWMHHGKTKIYIAKLQSDASMKLVRTGEVMSGCVTEILYDDNSTEL